MTSQRRIWAVAAFFGASLLTGLVGAHLPDNFTGRTLEDDVFLVAFQPFARLTFLFAAPEEKYWILAGGIFGIAVAIRLMFPNEPFWATRTGVAIVLGSAVIVGVLGLIRFRGRVY